MGIEDQLYRYLKLYKKSPKWLKTAMGFTYSCIPYRVRYGKTFNQFMKLIEESRYWTLEEHRAYQEKNLRNLLQYAYLNVPFYSKKYKDNGVHPEDFKRLEDISRFPFVSREDIQRNLKQFGSIKYSKKMGLYATTSGSSGVPLEFYYHKGITRPKERAFVLDMWQNIGYRVGNRVACFRGEVITDKRRPWYFDPIDRQLVMSSYLLDENRVSLYCQQIRKFNPYFLRGYPFMILWLVQLMQQANETPFRLKGIILESENAYTEHIAYIKDFMGCHVYHSYGHAERLVAGGICAKNEAYHMYPEYGYLEVIQSNGRHASIGERGEIVATGFDNWVMPLIRYRTRDFAIFGGNYCKECHKNYLLLSTIEGREEEYVYLSDGRKIPFHNLLAGIHGVHWAVTKRIQCVQNTKGEIVLKIVPISVEKRKIAERLFKHAIESRVENGKLNITVEFPDIIPTIASGKTKLFIQQIID